MTPIAWFFFLLPVSVAAVVLVAFHRARPGAALVPGVAMFAWFVLVSALARSGVLTHFEAVPPRIPLLALSTLLVATLVAQHRGVREALDAMPPWWPVALQTFRAPLEFGIYLGVGAGLFPEQMTFTGQNFDVLAGLSAPVLAAAMSNGRGSRRVQVVWQVLAIGLLINVLRVAITSAPGPLHRPWPGEPLTVVAQWPFALLPGVLVPAAVLGHVAALRGLFRGTARGTPTGGGVTPVDRSTAIPGSGLRR